MVQVQRSLTKCHQNQALASGSLNGSNKGRSLRDLILCQVQELRLEAELSKAFHICECENCLFIKLIILFDFFTCYF